MLRILALNIRMKRNTYSSRNIGLVVYDMAGSTELSNLDFLTAAGEKD